MLRYCDSCESIVDAIEGRCCRCGQKINSYSSDTQKYYLPEPSEMPTTEVDPLWERVCQHMQASNLNAAAKLCSKILEMCPGHDDAKSLHSDIQVRFQRAGEFYESIRSGINHQPLPQLSALLTEAVEIYPDHPEGHLVQTQLLALTTEYKKVVPEGIRAIGAGHWQEALSNLERANRINPGCPAIAAMVRFVNEVCQQVQTARSGIDAALKQGKHQKALSLARAIDRYVESVKSLANDDRE